MNSINNIILLVLIVTCVYSYRHNHQFITLNTSGTKHVVSISLATNLNQSFTIQSPLLFDTQNNTVNFTPNQPEGRLDIAPSFSADSNRLYNEHSGGEFWYGFKRHSNQQTVDTVATFALAKITVQGKTQDFVLPLFTFPISLLNFEDLYKCDDVLISFKRSNNFLDVTIFGEKESWVISPKAKWGYKHKDKQVNFSRQTFPLGTEIEIDVGGDKYCVLREDLPKNTYNLVEQNVYTLQDLLVKYSKSLQLKTKAINSEL